MDVVFQRGARFRDVSFMLQRDRARAFLLASSGWEAAGNRGEADHYFYEAMVARRNAKRWYNPQRWLEWLFIDLTCRYGVSWQRLVVSASAIILISSLVCWLGRGIVATWHRPYTLRNLWTAFYLSFVAFFSLDWTDYRLRDRFKIMFGIVRVVGVLMLALFIVVFTRQFMR